MGSPRATLLFEGILLQIGLQLPDGRRTVTFANVAGFSPATRRLPLMRFSADLIVSIKDGGAAYAVHGSCISIIP